jgi:competence protein ComEC
VIEVLATIRGQPQRPLLVVSSPRLIEATGHRRFLPAFRDRLAQFLLRAAGTNAGRIRTAELAAALALGRRDLVPTARRDRWRSSGLAHLLAVSGLHVGLVGGGVWLCAILLGAGPRTARLIVLAALPSYALLAGASPSALRAAMMGGVYLGARLLGRAVLPMSAVLLAAFLLLLAAPALVADAGFQLTVVITAALVRWVPPAARALPGPRWLTGALAVPVVAQVAAAPIVAWHFRSLIPGAVLTNLLALPLLGPTVLASVAAALVAPVWPAAAALGLDIVRLLAVGLHLASGPARTLELVAPPLPIILALVLAVVGWLALQPGRRARVGAVGWLAANALFAAWWLLPAAPHTESVELLPVVDGAAVVVTAGADSILIDAGRYQRDASRMLTSSHRRRLQAVVLSHSDEDHVGGVAFVLRSTPVECLIVPRWMVAEAAAVPLLRAARRTRTRVMPVARGSAIQLGTIRLETIWPPAHDPPSEENERSLVARILTEHGVVVITSDIGRPTENRLARLGHLGCDVLVVPHHGSRSSTSDGFVDATSPAIALVPAGPGNTYGHPHPETLSRLVARRIPSRVPARDGWCGARYHEGRWTPFP